MDIMFSLINRNKQNYLINDIIQRIIRKIQGTYYIQHLQLLLYCSIIPDKSQKAISINWGPHEHIN